MTLFTAITDATCGEACWEAREDICRCSCGGKNHGTSRDGIIPERTSKIDSYRYKLIAVGSYEVETQGRELSKAAGEFYIYHCLRQRGKPYRLKAASKSQLARWHELEPYREFANRPPYPAVYTLWERLVNHAR